MSLNKNMKEKILVIVAHPDDEGLGCGGYISKFLYDKKFRVIFIGEGTTCRFKKNEHSKNIIKEIKSREKCAVKALNILGIKDFHFYHHPCGRFDSVDILDINKLIENEISTFKPNKIITHNSDDCNNDHRIVSRSVSMATRPSPHNEFLKTVMTFEILSSTEWNFEKSFQPNYFVEINEANLKKKIKSVYCYKSEIQKGNMPRNKDGIMTLAKDRGKMVNKKFAEAFHIIRDIV
mgnify:FL=1